MSCVTLKPRYSLVGKSLIPVILQMKALADPVPEKDLARLKKDHCLTKYSVEELIGHFEGLTGENLHEVVRLSGKDENIANIRSLLHFSILHANVVGAPKSQPLREMLTPSPSTSVENVSHPSGEGQPHECREGEDSFEVRLKAMEKKVEKATNQSAESQVEECLKQKETFQLHSNKKMKLDIVVPEWELSSGFNPSNLSVDKTERWVNYRGESTQPSTCSSAEDVARRGVIFDIDQLSFRDPNCFIPGALHSHYREWEEINAPDFVLNWIKNGIDIEDFLVPFKGNFRGVSYDSAYPPPIYIPNSKVCQQFQDFIVQTLIGRIKNGSLSVLGKVGECDPPYLVMPLTVEPSKPRMCHDERYLNLWIKNCPFTLDTLREIPRLVERDSYMTRLDDKSGYDHILLHDDSRKYFGLQFGGWFMTYNTLPFGFKASAFIYHSTGLAATGFCRSLGVPCLQYIDDRWIGMWLGQQLSQESVFQEAGSRQLASKAMYIVCQVLSRLGYFLNLSKSVFIPTKCIKFLRLLVDSTRLAFIIPEDKKQKFVTLREIIWQKDVVDITTLQKFAGKCISFLLAVPAAKLFTKEVNRAIGFAAKNGGSVSMSDALKEEIAFWRFLDTWNECFPWRTEKHFQICMSSDASNYKWGAVVELGSKAVSISDYFPEGDARPIHIKEAQALYNALLSLSNVIRDHRVDMYVDNLACVYAWENQSAKDPCLVHLMKEVWNFVFKFNVELKLVHVSSEDNPADIPSRRLSAQDCMLSRHKFLAVDERFGPHGIDLMALDSNCMLDKEGKPLRHFTPYPTPFSAGVNVFSQDISAEVNPYIYPPYNLVLPLLKYLRNQKVKVDKVPRIWKPGEVCHRCGYVNDSGFSYCQSCGFCKVLVEGNEMGKFSMSDNVALQRIVYLNELLDSRSYDKKKRNLKKEFKGFLAHRSRSLWSALPEDVRAFLMFKDKDGKTQVHDLACQYLGENGFKECGCPRRLSASTVSGFISQLKSIFQQIGRVDILGETSLGGGNPANNDVVKRYAQSIKLEQAISHISQKQAKPLFLDKLTQISVYLESQLQKRLSVANRFLYLRDQSFFKIQFFAGDRTNDLALSVIQEMKRLPYSDGLLFSHTVGKTLSNGRVNDFVIPKLKDHRICPVRGLNEYVKGARSMGINMSVGYIFRPLDSSRSEVLDTHVTSSVMYDRLKKYMKILDIDEGETPHGIRAGCALTLMASSPAPVRDIMDHVGWRNQGSFNRYTRIGKMVGSDSVGSMLAGVVESEMYEVRNIFDKLGDKSSLSGAFT